MSTLIAPSTELEAVNRMLASIGQSPVNTLTVSGVPDVVDALQVLRDTLRDVEAQGWSWNTDRNYSLSPQIDGTIKIPSGAMEVDASTVSSNIVVRRNPNTNELSLYDLDNQTYTFTAAVEVEIIWAYPFEDIPQTARTYVSIAAARKFQAQRVSSPLLDGYNDRDEQRAWDRLWRSERRTRDTNSFRANPSARRSLRRRFG
ncbi:phage tail protein [Novosphingobium meiothermophilum]|uniref:phage tail protein n=1 Tax=Novosphingobium meiothermophilum TaxID=2202251 RepID=UPI0011AB405C|nr:phage tail protein [Novosphingobium meiothermophilum]